MKKTLHYLATQWKIASLSALAVFLLGFFQVTRANIVTGNFGAWHCNDGIAFGILLPEIVFTILWSVVMCGVLILWRAYGKQTFTGHLPYLLITVGAISNIMDRMIHGCVVDYLSIVPWNFFNLADSAIVIGAGLLLFTSWKTKK